MKYECHINLSTYTVKIVKNDQGHGDLDSNDPVYLKEDRVPTENMQATA